MRTILTSILCAMIFSTSTMAEENCGELFCTLDMNHDGNVSKKEFLEGGVKVDRQKAVTLFPDMRDAEYLDEGALKERLFDRMDKNRNGLLDKEEWTQMAPNILNIRF